MAKSQVPAEVLVPKTGILTQNLKKVLNLFVAKSTGCPKILRFRRFEAKSCRNKNRKACGKYTLQVGNPVGAQITMNSVGPLMYFVRDQHKMRLRGPSS